MSVSPNSSRVQHAVDVNYANKKRSTSLKWIVVNIVLFLLFAYDLCCKCPGYTSPLHYVELLAAAALGANALLHARRLAGSGPPAPRPAPRPPPRPAREADAPLSAWRAHSPPPSPPPPPAPRPERAAPDHFIADQRSLDAYLRQWSSRAAGAPAAAPGRAPGGAAPYQLSAPAAAPADAQPERAPQLWRRLHVDPQRLEQWNLNLRLWLHVTILERLQRQLAAPEGLRAAPLLRYLEPFADQRYAAQRIRELVHGGCLSGYRWNGGGSDWDEAKPTDAELVLHLLATYLDAQLPPAPGARAFSAEHLSAAPAPPPRGPAALALHRAAARPPHYVLALGEHTVELARGRNNLLHTLLLFLAAAARREPPRLHLGRAGLNMLWIIGR